MPHGLKSELQHSIHTLWEVGQELQGSLMPIKIGQIIIKSHYMYMVQTANCENMTLRQEMIYSYFPTFPNPLKHHG